MSRILIIDDDEELCEELKDILEIDNHSITLCHNGSQGLDFIEHNLYDFVLLDMKMPLIDGHQVLKLIKNQHPLIKVIVITGTPLEGNLIQQDGVMIDSDLNNLTLKLADDVICKPFDPGRVLSGIKKFATG